MSTRVHLYIRDVTYGHTTGIFEGRTHRDTCQACNTRFEPVGLLQSTSRQLSCLMQQQLSLKPVPMGCCFAEDSACSQGQTSSKQGVKRGLQLGHSNPTTQPNIAPVVEVGTASRAAAHLAVVLSGAVSLRASSACAPRKALSQKVCTVPSI